MIGRFIMFPLRSRLGFVFKGPIRIGKTKGEGLNLLINGGWKVISLRRWSNYSKISRDLQKLRKEEIKRRKNETEFNEVYVRALTSSGVLSEKNGPGEDNLCRLPS